MLVTGACRGGFQGFQETPTEIVSSKTIIRQCIAAVGKHNIITSTSIYIITIMTCGAQPPSPSNSPKQLWLYIKDQNPLIKKLVKYSNRAVTMYNNNLIFYIQLLCENLHLQHYSMGTLSLLGISGPSPICVLGHISLSSICFASPFFLPHQ